MAPTGTPPAAITPQGIRDGDPQVLAALAAVRGPAVVAFATTICEPSYVVRAAADAFARFRAAVADPSLDTNVHPDALLLRCARRAALDLAPRGPDLGCGPATDLLAQRAERTIKPTDATLLNRHLETCEHCRDLADRLDAADRAYRESDDGHLDPATVAPMVAALAAAAPLAPPNGGSDPSSARIASTERITSEEPAPAEPEPAAADTTPVAEEEPEPTPEPEAEQPEAEQPEAEDPEAEEPEREVPIGTRRLTGAPSSYYELPPLPPRERGARAKKAVRGAAAAGGLAASLTRRAGAAARKRLDKPASPPPVVEEPAAADADVTDTWNKVESIEFPAVAAVDEPEPEPRPTVVIDDTEYDPLAPDDPELRESAARAAARHYRRQRHRDQKIERLPSGGRPPQLLRPIRDRGPHLPLSAHGPRDLALPAGLVVVAVLVVMAVSGVFGGGSSTPATGTQAKAAPETLLVSQSVTALSLTDAERIAARSASVTAP
jgi:hypothetical protein